MREREMRERERDERERDERERDERERERDREDSVSGNLAFIRRGISKRVARLLATNEFGLTVASPSAVFLVS